MATKILIEGHSFIKRLKIFIRDTRPQFSYALNLRPAEFMIQYSGVSGGTIDKLWNDSSVQDYEPHILIIQCGSNDLCKSTSSPEDVCSSLINYCEHLLNSTTIKHIVILQILQRLTPDRPYRYEVDIEWNKFITH